MLFRIRYGSIVIVRIDFHRLPLPATNIANIEIKMNRHSIHRFDRVLFASGARSEQHFHSVSIYISICFVFCLLFFFMCAPDTPATSSVESSQLAIDFDHLPLWNARLAHSIFQCLLGFSSVAQRIRFLFFFHLQFIAKFALPSASIKYK